MIDVGAKLVRANLRHAERIALRGVDGGLAVYGRSGQSCQRCATTIVPRADRRSGRCTGAPAARPASPHAARTSDRWTPTPPPPASSTTSRGAAPVDPAHSGPLDLGGLSIRAASVSGGETQAALIRSRPDGGSRIDRRQGRRRSLCPRTPRRGDHSVAMAWRMFIRLALRDG